MENITNEINKIINEIVLNLEIEEYEKDKSSFGLAILNDNTVIKLYNSFNFIYQKYELLNNNLTLDEDFMNFFKEFQLNIASNGEVTFKVLDIKMLIYCGSEKINDEEKENIFKKKTSKMFKL